jgi:hypothetical protein
VHEAHFLATLQGVIICHACGGVYCTLVLLCLLLGE